MRCSILAIELTFLVFFSVNSSIFSQSKTIDFVNDEIKSSTLYYEELKRSGLTDHEAFEDLGNAYFIMSDYAIAVHWYEKLYRISKISELDDNLLKRYEHAIEAAIGNRQNQEKSYDDKLAEIRNSYGISLDKTVADTDKPKNLDNEQKWDIEKFSKPATSGISDFASKNEKTIDDALYVIEKWSKDGWGNENIEDQKTKLILTRNGRTAYFSKSNLIKPEYGFFSKKERVSKIYKIEKIKGQWGLPVVLKLCPKYASATDPVITGDGKRLFFASNMPGTFGKFDIYVADLQKNGSFGVAKNLGKKVNTRFNDLHPQIASDNTLLYSSNEKGGFGGYDIYQTQIVGDKVSQAFNLGKPINSERDEYPIRFKIQEGNKYLLTNRAFQEGEKERIVSLEFEDW